MVTYFAALNTMYNSVAVRTKEIATLRALGFKSFSVGVSTLLALIGAVIAAVTVYGVFNGYTAMTSSSNGLAVQLDFAVTPRLIGQGMSAP